MTRPPKWPAPGIHPGVTFERYLAFDKAVNSSTLRNLRFGARECQFRRRNGTKVTPAMKTGQLVHTSVLSIDDYLRRVAEWSEPVYEDRPKLEWDKRSSSRYVTLCGRYLLERTLGNDWRAAYTKDDGTGDALVGTYGGVTAAKSACREHYERTVPRVPKLDADGNPKISPQNPNSATYRAFLDANPNRIIVTRKEIEAAKRIARAVRENPAANEALSGIWDTEVSIVWRDPDTGVLCKARIDWLTDPSLRRILIGDLKTCRDHAPPGFPRDAAKREYYAQMAWYCTGLRECCWQLYGTEPDITCKLLAVQSSGSHDSTVYPLSGDELRAGDKLNAERLQQLLYYDSEYGDATWPGRCPESPLNLAEHAPHVLGDIGMPTMGGNAMTFGEDEF